MTPSCPFCMRLHKQYPRNPALQSDGLIKNAQRLAREKTSVKRDMFWRRLWQWRRRARPALLDLNHLTSYARQSIPSGDTRQDQYAVPDEKLPPPSSVLGARETGYSCAALRHNRRDANIPASTQILLYFGTVCGVLLSLMVHRIETWETTRFEFGVPTLVLSIVVSIFIIPTTYRTLHIQPSSPFFIQFLMFVENGVFSPGFDRIYGEGCDAHQLVLTIPPRIDR